MQPNGASDRPPKEGNARDGGTSALLQRTVLVLSRAAKSARLYPAGSDVRARFLDDLLGSLTLAFEAYGALRLTLAREQVLCDEEVVFHQEGRDEPIPGRLYWDGVRELTFLPGLDADELTEFLELIGNPPLAGEHDDLATLLWTRAFAHIEHVAIDALVDAGLSFDPLAIPEELGAPLFDQVDAQMHEAADPAAAAAAGRAFLDDLRTAAEDSNLEVFHVGADERAFLCAELHGQGDSLRSRLELIELVGTIVSAETDPASLAELAQILGGGLRRFVVEGDLAAARQLAGLLRESVESRPDLDVETRVSLAEPLTLSLAEADLVALVHELDRPGSAALAHLPELVAALPVESAPTWCEVLGRLQTATARRRLIEALAPSASERPEVLEPFLRDRRWYLVRNVALLLGRSGEPRAFAALRTVLRHPEARVRKEALRAIAGLAGAGAEEIVVHALRDPEASLRRWAAQTCAGYGTRAASALESILRAPEFAAREMDERAMFLEAYAYAAREAAVQLLESLLAPRGLFRAKPPEPLRVAVLEALAAAGGTRAAEILRDHSNDRSTAVRQAVRSALARGARDAEARAESPEAAA